MKPCARVVMNGKDMTAKWSSVLESVSVSDEAGNKADACEIAFDNREGFSAPPIGAEIKIWLGYEPEPIYMGSYKVQSWSKRGPRARLTVSAHAADLTTAIRAARMKSYHGMTVQQIVEQVAARNGLTAVVDATIGASAIDHIDQQNESDTSFLTRLAKRQGAVFKLADGKVLFAAKGSATTPSGKAKTAITITPDMVSTWEANCDKRGSYKSASAYYMDHVAGRRRTAVDGTDFPRHRDKRLYGSKAEAAAAAKANRGDLTRGEVTVSLDGPGNPMLFAEALVTLKGFDPDVDGSYLVKNATHTFDSRGYKTSISLETKAAAAADAKSAAS